MVETANYLGISVHAEISPLILLWAHLLEWVMCGKICSKLSQLGEWLVILYQVVQYKVMETMGNSSYSQLDEEKGVIPCG